MKGKDFKHIRDVLHKTHLSQEELMDIFEGVKSMEVYGDNRAERFNILDILMYELEWGYEVKFSIDEKAYTLLEKEEQEPFLAIINTSKYPYVERDFEADDVRERYWEKELYFNFFNGHMYQMELYCEPSNSAVFYKNLERLIHFRNLEGANLLFYGEDLVKEDEIMAHYLKLATKYVTLYLFSKGKRVPQEFNLFDDLNGGN